MSSYGVTQQTVNQSDLDRGLEELNILGFTVLENVLSPDVVEQFAQKVDQVLLQQSSEIGRDVLAAMGESDIARALMSYDDLFIDLITNETAIAFVEKVLGPAFVLVLQNAIVTKPHQAHHQSAWHRDLPYQEYTVSSPLALSVYFCLDNYSEESGGTWLLPHSHRLNSLPSKEFIEKQRVCVNAPKGSIVLFDSFVFHSAGSNTSDQQRRGINHVYARPIIQQQIDLPRLLQGRHSEDPFLNMVLGYRWAARDSVESYRREKLARSQAD